MLTPGLLETFWPVARPRLVHALTARGIDTATAEEAVVEAAARALSRRIVVDDLNDFCRWAFVVARNVAVDAGRRSRQLTLVADLPDTVDGYDLAHDVEVRERLRNTAAAIKGLSITDRTVLLQTVNGDDRKMARREAVHQAVRRHRARSRLQRALGRLGGWIGWLRIPVRPSRLWMSAPSEWTGAAVASLLTATLGWGVSPVIGTPALPLDLLSAPVAPTTATASDASSTTAAARPASTRSASSAMQPRAIDDEAPADWWGDAVTPSPSYAEDHTLYATGGEQGCDRTGGCPVLYKSTDGGDRWTRLPARGRGFGSILLPPAYPRDPRIFSVSLFLFQVSTDGGETFATISPVTGPASMSPRFSDGDPRILFGADRSSGAPTAVQYVDGEPVLRPVDLLLPVGAIPLKFAFDPHVGPSRRMLVTVVEAPFLRADRMPGRTALYSCDPRTCERVVDLGISGRNAVTAWTATPGTVLVSTPAALHRSTDGGRTFAEVPLPGTGADRQRMALVAGSDGRLFTSIVFDGTSLSRLFESRDHGLTWKLVNEEEGAFANLSTLPDGALAEGRTSREGGVRCSRDGGRTWIRTCARR